MVQTALKPAGFHGARAAQSVLAVRWTERLPLQRTTKSRNDGPGFLVEQRSLQQPEAQRQQELHSWGEREFASEGSRLAAVAGGRWPLGVGRGGGGGRGGSSVGGGSF